MTALDFPDYQPNPVVPTEHSFVVVAAAGDVIVAAPAADHHLVMAGLVMSNQSTTPGQLVIDDSLLSFTLMQVYLPANSTQVVPLFSFNMPAGDGLVVAALLGTWSVSALYGVV